MKKQGILIRPYQKSDFKEVMKVFETNVPEFFAESEHEDLIHYLKHEIEDYFILTQENRIIGAGGINYDDDQITARLSWDFLDKEIQHQGAGRLLTEHRIQYVQQNMAIQRLIVRTSQFAEGFYQKLGFIVKERTADYWAQGFDLVFMEYPALR